MAVAPKQVIANDMGPYSCQVLGHDLGQAVQESVVALAS